MAALISYTWQLWPPDPRLRIQWDRMKLLVSLASLHFNGCCSKCFSEFTAFLESGSVHHPCKPYLMVLTIMQAKLTSTHHSTLDWLRQHRAPYVPVLDIPIMVQSVLGNQVFNRWKHLSVHVLLALPSCTVLLPKSPFAMMVGPFHVQTDTQTYRHTDTHTNGSDSMTSTADTGGKNVSQGPSSKCRWMDRLPKSSC